MYAVFYGSDRKGARDAAAAYIKKNQAPEAATKTILAEEYQPGLVADMLGAQSLFGGSECYILDTPSLDDNFNEEVTSSLPELAESKNTFVIMEGPLLVAAKKQYTEHAAFIEEWSAKKEGDFNLFALADALATKDKRKLWVLLQEARLAGLREEEIVGILWWQLKALRLAKLTKNAAEAGMKDFPYNKAKRALAKFTNGEVDRLSQELLVLYHEGHAGIKAIDLGLEKWALSL